MLSKHNMHSVLIDYSNERSITKGFTDALVSVAMSVFGSPIYVIDGDMFFGQDSLDLAEYALNKKFQKTISELKSRMTRKVIKFLFCSFDVSFVLFFIA